MTRPTARVGVRAWLGLRLAPRPWPLAPGRWVRPTRRRAVRAVVAFLVFAVLVNVGFGLVLDYGPPRLRDPEYGKRLTRVKARVRENPGRPLVLVLGSSRVAMGVRPGAAEADGGDPDRPMLFNFALAGSGPVMELMVLRRAFHDGVRPAAVLVEYWPAFLREDGGYREEARIDPLRLRPVDRPLVREFFRDPDKAERALREQRLNPWFSQRHSLLNQTLPGWLPYNQRTEAMWEKIDDWGWLPGHEKANAEERQKAMTAAAGYYVPLFAHYEVSPTADRALRQLVAECRDHGVPVALVYLPESTAFRAFMPPEAVRRADEHLARIRTELDLPLLDARGWLSDDELPDGFHPLWDGAATLTRKLAAAVPGAFPELQHHPANPER